MSPLSQQATRRPAAVLHSYLVSMVLPASTVARCRLRARLPHKLRATPQNRGVSLRLPVVKPRADAALSEGDG